MIIGLAIFAVALFGLVLVVARLQQHVRELDTTVRDLRNAFASSQAEAERVEALIDRADAITGRVDSASKLAYTTFAVPVIKAMSLGAGTKGAARRLRERNGHKES